MENKQISLPVGVILMKKLLLFLIVMPCALSFDMHAGSALSQLLITQEQKDQNLITAVKKGNLIQLQHCIDNGANINTVEKEILFKERPDLVTEKEPALILAAKNNHLACLELLLDNKAQVDKKGSVGATALSTAAKKGYLGCLKTLLIHGAVVDRPGPLGIRALKEAAKEGHLACLNELIKHVADIHDLGTNSWVTVNA